MHLTLFMIEYQISQKTWTLQPFYARDREDANRQAAEKMKEKGISVYTIISFPHGFQTGVPGGVYLPGSIIDPTL